MAAYNAPQPAWCTTPGTEANTISQHATWQAVEEDPRVTLFCGMGIQLTYSFGGICWIWEVMHSRAWVKSSFMYLYKTTEDETRNGAIDPNLASPIGLLPARDCIFKHPSGMKTSNQPCALKHSNHTQKYLYQSEICWQYPQEDANLNTKKTFIKSLSLWFQTLFSEHTI